MMRHTRTAIGTAASEGCVHVQNRRRFETFAHQVVHRGATAIATAICQRASVMTTSPMMR